MEMLGLHDTHTLAGACCQMLAILIYLMVFSQLTQGENTSSLLSIVCLLSVWQVNARHARAAYATYCPCRQMYIICWQAQECGFISPSITGPPCSNPGFGATQVPDRRPILTCKRYATPHCITMFSKQIHWRKPALDSSRAVAGYAETADDRAILSRFRNASMLCCCGICRRSLQQPVGWDVTTPIKDLSLDIDSILAAMSSGDPLKPMFQALKELNDIGTGVMSLAHELDSIIKAVRRQVVLALVVKDTEHGTSCILHCQPSEAVLSSCNGLAGIMTSSCQRPLRYTQPCFVYAAIVVQRGTCRQCVCACSRFMRC